MTSTLRAATLEDADALLELRNDPGTREQSFSADPLERSDHVAWLSRKLSTPDATRLYVAEQGNRAVGYVRVDVIGSRRGEVSVAVDSSVRGGGIGRQIIAMGTARAAEGLGVGS